MAFGKMTYSQTNELRESLLDILRDVSPNEDNYFVSNLGSGRPALQQLHQWNLFTEARTAAAVTGNVEGAETSFPDLQTETRSTNYTIIIDAPVKLSRTRASIANVTGEDALTVEKSRALRRLKNKMEYAIVNGTVAAGNGSTARGLAGIDACISTNVTARASGQSFTETELNDMVQTSWTAVGADYVMDVLVGPAVIKRRVGTFGTNLTRNVPVADKRLTQEIRVYDSDLGPTIKILAHKDVRAAAGTLTAIGLREDLFELSFLVGTGEPHWEERPATGDWKGGVYISEFTVDSYGETASVKRTGFNTGL